MTRTRLFIYNSVSTALLQFIVLIVGFITPKVILTTYGSEINGLVSSIIQFINYFSLVEAGLASASIYALYKPLAENNHTAINSVLSATKKFYTQSGYIFLLLTIGLAFLYPIYIHSASLSPYMIGCLVLVLGTNGALDFFTLAKYRVLLVADQKTYIISLASCVQIIVNTCFIIFFAYYNIHIVVARFVALFSVFLRSFLLYFYCKHHYSYLNYHEIQNVNALNKRWDALYLQILGGIQNGTPIVLITVILKDLNLVSVYTVFNMVLVGINGLLSIFTSGLSASFGDLISRGDTKTLQFAYREFELFYYYLITIIYGVTFVSLMPFTRIYTSGITDVNYNLPLIGFLFVLNGLLYNLKTPQGILIIASGLYKETKWQTTFQGLICIIVGALLAPHFQLAGILIGSILSNLYRDIDLAFYIPKHITKLPVKDTLYRFLIISIELMLIYIPYLTITVSIGSYGNWIIYTCCMSLYIILIVCLFGYILDKNSIKILLIQLKSLGRKRK